MDPYLFHSIHILLCSDRFYFEQSIRDTLGYSEVEFPVTAVYKSFETMSQVADVWEYLLNPFYDNVYTSASFDQGPYVYPNVTSIVGNRPGFLNGQNRILGVSWPVCFYTSVISLHITHCLYRFLVVSVVYSVV
jgi:hypothetical protein